MRAEAGCAAFSREKGWDEGSLHCFSGENRQTMQETHSEIIAEDLLKSYRRKAVVNGISLNVKQGEVVGLLGPNGAGKTTTFYMIVGLVKPQRGRVRLDGQDITRLPMYRRARAGISYLPQEASVFRNLTVEENLHLVLQMQGLSKKEYRERADHLMEDLHITHKRYEYGSRLSGGERRRVEIARALAADPKFILLDEPFTGVDPKAIEDIEDIIIRLTQSDAKIGILITDHNVEAMLRIAERLYIVVDGQIKVEGLSRDLRGNAEARSAYFGERSVQTRDYAREAREAAEEELRQASGVYDDIEDIADEDALADSRHNPERLSIPTSNSDSAQKAAASAGRNAPSIDEQKARERNKKNYVEGNPASDSTSHSAFAEKAPESDSAKNQPGASE